jgi:hypothetical protein
MERTGLGEVRFFHLDVVTETTLLGLLLGNRAGEEYAEALASVGLARQLIEVTRADTITLLVDGAKLKDSRTRHNAVAEALQMLQVFSEAGANDGEQRLAIVLTKIDVMDDTDRGRIDQDFSRLVDAAKTRFGATYSRIQSFRVAACPATGSVARGSGLAALMMYWLQPRSANPIAIPKPSAQSRMIACAVAPEEAHQ